MIGEKYFLQGQIIRLHIILQPKQRNAKTVKPQENNKFKIKFNTKKPIYLELLSIPLNGDKNILLITTDTSPHRCFIIVLLRCISLGKVTTPRKIFKTANDTSYFQKEQTGIDKVLQFFKT